MSVKHTLFTTALALASAAYSPVSFSGEVTADANNKPTNVKIDSIPPVSVTCYRCEELAQKYLASREGVEAVSRQKGSQLRINQEIEEAE